LENESEKELAPKQRNATKVTALGIRNPAYWNIAWIGGKSLKLFRDSWNSKWSTRIWAKICIYVHRQGPCKLYWGLSWGRLGFKEMQMWDSERSDL